MTTVNNGMELLILFSFFAVYIIVFVMIIEQVKKVKFHKNERGDH